MPRLIPPELGNGKRPSDPAHSRGAQNDTVPILDVSEDAHALIGDVHDKALDPDDDTQLLTGAVVIVDNDEPLDGSDGGGIRVHVGGSTLHEAATEIITCVAALARNMPTWIAATDSDLAGVLAEHYTVKGYSSCKVIPMEEAS